MRVRPEEITDVLTPEGVARLQVGQVLMFDYEGSRNDMKITKIKNGRVWAKRIKTYHPDEVLVNGKSLSDVSKV
jgi:hypothetical protein